MDRFPKLSRDVARAEKTLQEVPDDVLALRDLGEWYAFDGLWDWAIDLLERARLGGEDVSPLTLARCYWQRSAARANAEERESDLAGAEREFKQAVAKKTEAPEFYLNLCLQAVQTEMVNHSPEKSTGGDTQ